MVSRETVRAPCRFRMEGDMTKINMPRLGATVSTPDGTGTVTDRADGEALVKLDSGSIMEITHGCWYPFDVVTVTGFNGDAMVYYGCRIRRASEIN